MKFPTEKLKGMVVRRYMATQVVTFTPEMTMREAVKTLVKYNYTGAPVVDPDGTLVGMLSEKDCLKVAVSSNADGAAGALVGDFMTTKVDTVTPETDLLNVAERFVGAPYKRLPVVERGKLVGQVSRIDVLRAIADLF
jgi:CBS domain-containing protein